MYISFMASPLIKYAFQIFEYPLYIKVLILQQDVRSAHEKLRRKMSPGTRQRMEEEK